MNSDETVKMYVYKYQNWDGTENYIYSMYLNHADAEFEIHEIELTQDMLKDLFDKGKKMKFLKG